MCLLCVYTRDRSPQFHLAWLPGHLCLLSLHRHSACVSTPMTWGRVGGVSGAVSKQQVGFRKRCIRAKMSAIPHLLTHRASLGLHPGLWFLHIGNRSKVPRMPFPGAGSCSSGFLGWLGRRAPLTSPRTRSKSPKTVSTLFGGLCRRGGVSHLLGKSEGAVGGEKPQTF